MKVVGFNGSARKKGNTVGALNTVFAELEKAGIETEMIHVGKEKVQGCIACYGCAKKQNEACTLKDDPVNEWIQKMKAADRSFFVATVNGSLFRHKVGAAVAAVRRSGGLPTVNTLNHYINYSEMIMPSSNYWNVAHGLHPGEMEQDGEGKQIMAVLGKNMAWIMNVLQHSKTEFPPPDPVEKTMTNFIR